MNATDLPALNVSGVIVSFQVSKEETFAVLFEGEKSNVSPIDKLPVSIRPTRIRRSSNLYTSCWIPTHIKILDQMHKPLSKQILEHPRT